MGISGRKEGVFRDFRVSFRGGAEVESRGRWSSVGH